MVRQAEEAEAVQLQVGVMIEVPAAALELSRLAKEVDFFSLGTNDLIQYVMAADRTNAQIASLYQPFHPAVIKLIAQTLEAAAREGRPIGMCGELAGVPEAIPLLLGLGLREFSVSPSQIPLAKAIIRRTNLDEVGRLAGEVLELPTAPAVASRCRSFLSSLWESEPE